jgi:hypothetical protein
MQAEKSACRGNYAGCNATNNATTIQNAPTIPNVRAIRIVFGVRSSLGKPVDMAADPTKITPPRNNTRIKISFKKTSKDIAFSLSWHVLLCQKLKFLIHSREAFASGTENKFFFCMFPC